MREIFGFGRYVRFIARRERIIGMIWILAMAGSAMMFTMIYPGLLTSAQDLAIMAQTMNTPAMIAMMGQVYGLESLSVASLMSQQCLIWYVIAAAVMNIFFINRYTRADEELGRLEMLRALPMGRLTSSVSALVCAFVLNAVISLLSAVGILATNIDGVTVAGAFVYACSIGATGFFFAGLTLLLAQLFSSSHSVSGVAFALMGLFYILRASGDMSDNALSIVSPMGLSLKVYAFYENQWWPIGLLLLEALLLGGLALCICFRRDVGEGVLPARPGRRHASRFLLSPMGLAWRLTRNSVLAWGLTALVAGLTYGSVMGEMESFVSSSEIIRQMLDAGGGSSLMDGFVSMMFSVMAILAMVPVINASLKLVAEEKRGRMEQIFALSVCRAKFKFCFVLIALLQSVLFMTLSPLGMYLASASTGLVSADALLKASLVYLPALWVVIGLSVVLAGFVPKLTPLIWGLFTYSFMMLYFGRLLDLPEFCTKLTPLGFIPQIPVQEFTWLPLIALCLVAAALTGLGTWAYTRRDIG